MRIDVLVLGGGIVGTALALSLAIKGRSVALVDKGAPGAATSFGNAGLIQSEAVMPYPFPRDPLLLVQYALNLKPEAHYHLRDVLHVAPYLWRYFRASSRAGQLKTAAANVPIFAACIEEHKRLAEAAGVAHMLRPGGWMKVFRTQRAMDAISREVMEDLTPFGVVSSRLDRAGVLAQEPNLSEAAIGGLHFVDPWSINDPQALTLAYARQFETLGGKVLAGDAMSLTELSDGWSVQTQESTVLARDCVVALGPWAPDLLRPLGYAVPMGIKRGYHVHMRPKGNARLGIPVLDAEVGYVMAPMAQGIRLTSGAEFARRDSQPTPRQIDLIEPRAKELFPLEGRVDTVPWMGARPCMPDMLPVMGKAGRHKGLWFNFGHAHHGLTLAGSAGRLLSEMIAGEVPFTDPAPYALERFG
ncbi:DadA Glycine/D-amino acid oxidases (deaminating) [Rhabdaerophilaceae bacterium]